MGRLNNKIVIVTGGNGLIGKSIVEKIISEGGTCINAEIASKQEHASEIIKCDITDESSIRASIAYVLEKYGRIDGLVNNAYPRTQDWAVKFEDIPVDSWRKNVDMQLNSIFMLCQQIIPIMKQNNCGSIVNISSIYGTVGPDFDVYSGTNMTMPAAYSAIKGGVVNFSRYLASYYGRDNIRVNCVSPGGIFDHQSAIFVNNYERKVPLGRMGTPADISPAVSFLLSDESSYITGHNLMVDGGWTAI